jgi:hypothetical protein
MLSLEEIRKIEPELAAMSDSDLELLRADLYETAQISFDLWREEKTDSKNPVWSFPKLGEEHKL